MAFVGIDMHDFIFWVPVRSEIPRVLYCKETVLGINGGCCRGLDQTSI